jgi:hypothetical protein
MFKKFYYSFYSCYNRIKEKEETNIVDANSAVEKILLLDRFSFMVEKVKIVISLKV